VPAGWLIRHRFVSLAFVMGLFRVLTQHLLGKSLPKIEGPQGLSDLLKPQNNSRSTFWESVITSATKFLLDPSNDSKVSNCIMLSEAKETHLRSSHWSQDCDARPRPNSDIQIILARIAQQVVFDFFETMRNCQSFDNGEVLILEFESLFDVDLRHGKIITKRDSEPYSNKVWSNTDSAVCGRS
jgi:hypothetical protein